MKEIAPCGKIDAVFEAPPSKAHTLRALFIASLAKGESILKNGLHADDQKRAAEALSMFGADIVFDGKNYHVRGTGGNLIAPGNDVFIGNSGVSARFLVPVAALAEGDSVIDGDARMRERPIDGLIDALAKTGVVASASESGCPPVKVEGKTFFGGNTEVRGNVSSQYLSAMLICAPLTERGLVVSVKGELKSKPYVDITLDVMREFGAESVNRDYKEFFVRGKTGYKAREYVIEGDYSSASYFFEAAAVTKGKVKVKNLNENSLQADKKMLEILKKMGATVSYKKGFVEVECGKLKGVEVDMGDCPDAVPALAVCAAFAKGKTVIDGISHLAVKESNRIEAIAKNLRKCGIGAVAKSDSLEIVGGNPKGAVIECFNDHRIAMAFSIMGLAVSGIVIDDEKAVGKSFPDFFDALEKAGVA